MSRKQQMIVRAAVLLACVWAVIAGVRGVAANQKITAERLQREVSALNFADWSQGDGPAPQARQREKEIRRIADMVNRLDFQERQRNRESRTGEEFFRVLSPREKELFIDLTIMESMGRFMEAIDQMPPEQRRSFVEQGLREIESGRTAEEMKRANQLGSDLIDRIAAEGMRAYFEKAGADTKLDLAPLMESMNEVMQGLRGSEFGPR